MSNRNRTLLDLLKLMVPQRWLLLAIIATSFLMTFSEGASLGIIYIFLGQSAGRLSAFLPFLDSLKSTLDAFALPMQVGLVCVLILLITAWHSACSFLSQYWSAMVRIRTEETLRRRIFEQFHRVQLVFIERQKMGAWLPLISQYNTQTALLLFSVATALGSVAVVLFYFAVLLVVNGPVTVLITVLLLFPLLAMRPLLERRIRDASRHAHYLNRKLFGVAQEHLSALKLIHLFNREAWSLDRYSRSAEAHTRAYLQMQKLVSISRPLFDFFTMAALAGVLVVSAFFWNGSTAVWQTQNILFLVIAMRLMGPIADFSALQTQYSQNAPALQAITEFLSPDDKPFLKNGSRPFTGLRRDVVLDHVGFHYPNESTRVLQDVCITIPRGKFVAVVGVSGAGKTTLVNLLTRLYDCTEGGILVDGVDLREWDLGSWNARVAVVQQDTFLFHDSVAENLRFAKPDASQQELEEAVRLAQAAEFIRSFPEGFQTHLLDRGVRLSGGQQQRIALARALLVNADLLILDEATSELDSQNERIIQQALDEYRKGRTVFAIAHRLSTIRDADLIYVLEGGRLMEQGTHNELMAKKGIYTRLVAAQSLEVR